MATQPQPPHPRHVAAPDDRDSPPHDWRRDDRGGLMGMGQSGYASGRRDDDRSLDFQARYQGYSGSYTEDHLRGDDDRWTSRGGSMRDRGYGWQERGYGGGNYGPPAPEHLDDRARVSHRGKGPSNYQRSDERIREQICELLTEHHDIDATNIEVTVNAGEVTLTGTVEDRRTKRLAEDVIDDIAGVKDVANQLRIARRNHSTS